MTARRLDYAEESRKPATGADSSAGVLSLPKSLSTGGISIITKRLVILAFAAITFVVAPQALKAADADA
jgi:hypothetical protein